MKNRSLSAYQNIFNDIYDKILSGIYAPGDQLDTENEMCKKYDVSRITIQKALKILVDKGLVIRIIGKGTFVATKEDNYSLKKNPLIGVIMCNISASFGTEILKSIEQAAATNGYSIIFKNSNYDRELEIKAIKELIDLNVAGIILQPTHGEAFNPEIMRLVLAKMPIVLIDRNLSGLSCSFVGSDNHQATRKVMKFLFAQGHKSICFMCSDPHNTTSTEQRIEEFKNRYLLSGNRFERDFIFSNIKSTLSQSNLDENKKEDIRSIKEYILTHPNVTCLFTLEYAICSLVQIALNELGEEYKEKISLVTFDHVSDPHIETDVAYIKQDEEEIGSQAVRLLIRSILGENETVKTYLASDFINSAKIKRIEE